MLVIFNMKDGSKELVTIYNILFLTLIEGHQSHAMFIPLSFIISALYWNRQTSKISSLVQMKREIA